MTHLTCTYPSDCLGTNITFHALLPKERMVFMGNSSDQEEKTYRFPVLYLLHGAFDSAENWLYNTNVAELVDKYKIAVILPSVGNSFYLDSPNGQPYSKFLTEELYDYAKEILPITQDPKKTFIGGCSMGGYGALYSLFKHPEKYFKAFCMSGALGIKESATFVRCLGGYMPEQFKKPKELVGSEWDINVILENADAKSFYISNPIMLFCGDKDHMRQANVIFSQSLSQKGLLADFIADEGEHTWEYWNKHLDAALNWLCN